MKCYCRLNLLRASVLKFERHDILRDSIRLPSGKLLSLEVATCIGFKVRGSRYITGLNWILELKVLVVCISYELLFSISSISIYYGTQSDIRLKFYCRLNLQRASVLNFEHLDILRDSIGYGS